MSARTSCSSLCRLMYSVVVHRLQPSMVAARDLSPHGSKGAARTSATLKNGFFIGGIFGGLGGVMRG